MQYSIVGWLLTRAVILFMSKGGKFKPLKRYVNREFNELSYFIDSIIIYSLGKYKIWKLASGKVK